MLLEEPNNQIKLWGLLKNHHIICSKDNSFEDCICYNLITKSNLFIFNKSYLFVKNKKTMIYGIYLLNKI